MRSLKFRAWVYYGDKLEKPHYSRDYDSLDRFFEDHDENAIGQCIEQYTGLKDKNGKEIYEGDIVKYSAYGENHIGQVAFSFIYDSEGYYVEKYYGWGIYRDGSSLENFAADDSLGDSAYDNMECADVKVIGNIHENPELVKEEK